MDDEFMSDVNELIIYRLESGWDPNTYEDDGGHLMLECIRNESTWGFEALMKAGVDPNLSVIRDRQVNILSECIAYGHEGLIALALQYGADPNADNVLHYALDWVCRESIIVNLLKHGADPNGKDSQGKTPLFVAFCNYNYEHVLCLLEHGADLTAMNGKGETILDLIMQTRWGNVTKLLRFPFRFSEHVKNHPEARRVWFRRKLTTLKCGIKFLSLHKRAVVTANHPDRLKEMGVFEEV